MSWYWTEVEVEALTEHYHSHGPNWEGWDECLPNRTYSAILHKAWSLGLKCDSHANTYSYGREPDLSARLAVSALDDVTKLRLAFVLEEVQ